MSFDYRFKEDVAIVTFPAGFLEENRGLKVCCKRGLKLADVADTDIFKNDLSGVFVRVSDPTDIVEFVIEKCSLANPLPQLGDLAIFPNDDFARGFIFDWRQYLDTFGTGSYTISVNFTISGIQGGYVWGQFDLLPYSIYNARGTARVYSEFNSKYQKLNVDFTNSNFKDTLRFNGFFGDRQPNMEINNLITKGRKSQKATRENVNIYTLTTDPVQICITRDLLDLHLLVEDKQLWSDHNASNHDYLIFDKGVVIVETAEIEYIKRSRLAMLTVKFGDRDMIDKSYYNRK